MKNANQKLPFVLKIGAVSLLLFILVVIIMINSGGKATAQISDHGNTVSMTDTGDAFASGEFTFKLNVDGKTVSVTRMEPSETTRDLIVPDSITHEGITYQVTDINFDNKLIQYECVRTITIPASVTGTILITSTQLNDLLPEDANTIERPYLVPFPNLEKVTFLGRTAPKSINIFSYLSYNDMIYHVPSGSEAGYEAVSIKSFSQRMLGHYGLDSDHTFLEYKVAPVIVSDTHNNPEPHLFQTQKGVYLVTESAQGGTGTVALIKAKELVRRYYYKTPNSGMYIYPEWDDYTIESEAAIGSYRYTVTALNTGALLDFRKITMLTIPDTITKMEDNSIYAGDYLNYVFFSKNCKIISDKIFNSGENGAQNGILFYVPNGVTKIEGSFHSIRIKQLYLPDGISTPKNLVKACDKIIFYEPANSLSLSNSIKLTSNKVTVSIGSTKKIIATNTKPNRTDTIHFLTMDPTIANVSDSGVITPKHKGTAYIVAFSEATGAHQLIQLTVKDTTFKKGIFTYRINYSKTPEVTIISSEPTKSQKVLAIPSSVDYKGKKYTVTQVSAGDYIIDELNWKAYTPKNGYPRIYDTLAPLISDKFAKASNITEVVYPSTIKRTVSSLGNLPKLKKIVFKGMKAPSLLAFSDQNYKSATIYVPKKALAAYKKTTWRKGGYEEYVIYHVYTEKSQIRLVTY
jgi:hypothetical protein